MDKTFKFTLPSPNFNKNTKDACKPKPHYLTPSGMSLLPREKQPPPMYGKHGATLPARYLKPLVIKDKQFVTPDTLSPAEKQYCEPCELELHSLEDLKRHRAQHEKCPVAGCLYKGHPSVMDKHINSLHTSGLFDKFKKLSTPEEIAAWREERRKRYPTLANVLLKQKAREQRQKRGERLETNKNRFGKANDRKRAQPNTQEDNGEGGGKRHRDENKTNRNKKNRRNKNKQPKNQELTPKIQNNTDQKDEKLQEESDFRYGGIKMFTGTCQLKNYKHCNDKKKVAANVLFELVGMYGSDDDDESEENSDDNDEDNNEEIKLIRATERNEENNDKSSLENYTEIEKSFINNEVNNSDVAKEERKDEYQKLNNYKSSFINTPLTVNIVNSTINEPIENGTSNQNDNSSDEAPEEIPIQRNISDYHLKSENSPKITFVEKSETKCSKLADQVTTPRQKQSKKRKLGLDYRKARLHKQNTMLEKLLESDIRHERNVLLQCVRYVCENNFFNIGQNKNHEILYKNKL